MEEEYQELRLPQQQPPKKQLTHDSSTLTSFMRPDAPDLTETAAFRHRKCSATRATSSSLALPSTGGDFSFASQVPSGACIREEARALGFTLICMSTVAISAYGLTSPLSGRARGRSPLAKVRLEWLVRRHAIHDAPAALASAALAETGWSSFPNCR